MRDLLTLGDRRNKVDQALRGEDRFSRSRAGLLEDRCELPGCERIEWRGPGRSDFVKGQLRMVL